ncbi:hypothetical protein [Brown algae RNA virus 1]|nr:hypothetical protein [Brown algae RNA virus 1]
MARLHQSATADTAPLAERVGYCYLRIMPEREHALAAETLGYTPRMTEVLTFYQTRRLSFDLEYQVRVVRDPDCHVYHIEEDKTASLRAGAIFALLNPGHFIGFDPQRSRADSNMQAPVTCPSLPATWLVCLLSTAWVARAVGIYWFAVMISATLYGAVVRSTALPYLVQPGLLVAGLPNWALNGQHACILAIGLGGMTAISHGPVAVSLYIAGAVLLAACALQGSPFECSCFRNPDYVTHTADQAGYCYLHMIPAFLRPLAADHLGSYPTVDAIVQVCGRYGVNLNHEYPVRAISNAATRTTHIVAAGDHSLSWNELRGQVDSGFRMGGEFGPPPLGMCVWITTLLVVSLAAAWTCHPTLVHATVCSVAIIILLLAADVYTRTRNHTKALVPEEGYCYLRMFPPGTWAEVSAALGAVPTLGDVRDAYHAFGWPSNTWLCVRLVSHTSTAMHVEHSHEHTTLDQLVIIYGQTCRVGSRYEFATNRVRFAAVWTLPAWVVKITLWWMAIATAVELLCRFWPALQTLLHAIINRDLFTRGPWYILAVALPLSVWPHVRRWMGMATASAVAVYGGARGTPPLTHDAGPASHNIRPNLQSGQQV